MKTVYLEYNKKENHETWFKKLFGFEEKDKYTVLDNIKITKDQNILISKANNRIFPIGRFGIYNCKSLRNSYITRKTMIEGTPNIEHYVIHDILELHHQYPNSVFQVASQLNCLEFSSPNMNPENGITDYEFDYTQGPGCALACAAATLYRNICSYEKQINNLYELEKLLPNYWTIKNGYVFSDKTKIQNLNEILLKNPWNTIYGKNKLTNSINIGIHKDVGVTFSNRFTPIEDDIRVTQCYCSAISCGYSNISNSLWEPLARIVLEANYEATIWTAALNSLNGGSKNVFLTFLGGGAFKNNKEWIADAIGRSIIIAKLNKLDLNIILCHYRQIDQEMKSMIYSYIENYEKKQN